MYLKIEGIFYEDISGPPDSSSNKIYKISKTWKYEIYIYKLKVYSMNISQVPLTRCPIK